MALCPGKSVGRRVSNHHTEALIHSQSLMAVLYDY